MSRRKTNLKISSRADDKDSVLECEAEGTKFLIHKSAVKEEVIAVQRFIKECARRGLMQCDPDNETLDIRFRGVRP